VVASIMMAVLPLSWPLRAVAASSQSAFGGSGVGNSGSLIVKVDQIPVIISAPSGSASSALTEPKQVLEVVMMTALVVPCALYSGTVAIFDESHVSRRQGNLKSLKWSQSSSIEESGTKVCNVVVSFPARSGSPLIFAGLSARS
jgi:hypothetical protein